MLSQQSLLVKPVAMVDPEDTDQAHRRGKLDATEGRGRNSSEYPRIDNVYLSYHTGYNAGMLLRNLLVGDVSKQQLAECAWFAEIADAKPVTRLTRAQLYEIERERPGLYEFEHRMEGR